MFPTCPCGVNVAQNVEGDASILCSLAVLTHEGMYRLLFTRRMRDYVRGLLAR